MMDAQGKRVRLGVRLGGVRVCKRGFTVFLATTHRQDTHSSITHTLSSFSSFLGSLGSLSFFLLYTLSCSFFLLGSSLYLLSSNK
jgi:hypothetical protein